MMSTGVEPLDDTTEAPFASEGVLRDWCERLNVCVDGAYSLCIRGEGEQACLDEAGAKDVAEVPNAHGTVDDGHPDFGFDLCRRWSVRRVIDPGGLNPVPEQAFCKRPSRVGFPHR